jgi:ABC-type sugar transport system ATPase subunit
MKILGGALTADDGAIAIDGRPIRFHSPHDARRAGIAIIYQEFNLIPGLNAIDNIFLGQEMTQAGFVRYARERGRATELFRRLGVTIDLDVPCKQLSTAQQQLVEIARALAFDARILVMDEPTAALTSHEVERLFAIIADLRKHGIGVIYISHRLNEIFTIADRVTILRDGRNVGARPVSQITHQEMVALMVGREMTGEFPPRSVTLGPPRLQVIGLRCGSAVRDVSFQVRRGEILALTGLVGAGRTETVRLIFGADRRDAGAIRLDGKPLAIHSPRDAIAAGIALLPEDRKTQGLTLRHSVRANFGLPNLHRFTRFGFVRARQERAEFRRYIDALRISLPGQEELAGNLSGGNQQKVVLAKWLARHCDVLIFDEPTRGIDVGAKYEIYLLMNELAAQGKSLIMVSSELPEVLGMADRVLVMHDGRVTGEVEARRSNPEEILKLAMM